MRLARAKGLWPRRVLYMHALRNALIPLTTVVALDFAAILGGAIITEIVFGWEGMGRFLLNGLTGPVSPDMNVVQALAAVAATVGDPFQPHRRPALRRASTRGSAMPDAGPESRTRVHPDGRRAGEPPRRPGERLRGPGKRCGIPPPSGSSSPSRPAASPGWPRSGSSTTGWPWPPRSLRRCCSWCPLSGRCSGTYSYSQITGQFGTGPSLRSIRSAPTHRPRHVRPGACTGRPPRSRSPSWSPSSSTAFGTLIGALAGFYGGWPTRR